GTTRRVSDAEVPSGDAGGGGDQHRLLQVRERHRRMARLESERPGGNLHSQREAARSPSEDRLHQGELKQLANRTRRLSWLGHAKCSLSLEDPSRSRCCWKVTNNQPTCDESCDKCRGLHGQHRLSCEGHRVTAAQREILPNARRTLLWSIPFSNRDAP